MKTSLFFLMILLLLSACSSKKIVHKMPAQNIVTLESHTKTPKKEISSYNLRNKTPITLALIDEYDKWYETPYVYGGDSFDGVDCSAFVQSVFMDAFRVRVPRTTHHQAQIGYEVTSNAREAGDIVLFKTGVSSRHSGIYIERGNFMHTSTTKGVTISNLNNPYWKNAYWQTRRILP